jgi:signal peptidase
MDWRSFSGRLGWMFKARFWARVIKDVAFSASVVAVLLGLLYAYTGTWPPLVTVDGRSMLPNMKQNDLIVVRGLDRVNVVTYSDAIATGYKTFRDYGDVIVYHPFGDRTKTPVIHRAMYHVTEGQQMWPGGPLAPHSGYLTQGDNNFLYDQSSGISQGQPVKDEWILGVSRYRIPYLGWIRSILG